MSDRDSAAKFNFDLRRTLILSGDISEWEIPITRVITRKREDPAIEAYLFPGGSD
jgi:hypothetical protein